MLNFRKVKIDDIDEWNKCLAESGEISCENAFVNILVWAELYHNEIAFKNSSVFLKSYEDGADTFRLPLGGNIKEGLREIEEYTKNRPHAFWTPDGAAFQSLPESFFEQYDRIESRNAFDYIYLQSDLAQLSGKKYHSKRNHISAFTKKHDWHYEPITSENMDAVKDCADAWYKENEQRLDRYMRCEKQGVQLMLDNMKRLRIKGGAIVTDGKVVAFTLGSPINKQVFDIHIEKALSEYAGAYTVINREFASRELGEYKYINREDDLGLEGLRKAKLSYHPQILLKKFYLPKISPARHIYREAFGDDEDFEAKLFSICKSSLKTLTVDGEIVSILFLLPCKIYTESGCFKANYLFAAATDKRHRSKGYASSLIRQAIAEGTPIFLRPADESLQRFYEKLGFCKFQAQSVEKGVAFVEPIGEFNSLCETIEPQLNEQFTIMGIFLNNFDGKLYFPNSMY